MNNRLDDVATESEAPHEPGPARGRMDADVLAVAAVSIAAITVAAVLTKAGGGVYQFILGELDPTLTTFAVSALGISSLLVLKDFEWFAVGGGGRKGLAVATLGGSLLTLPVIIVDCLGGFPRDMNVSAPESLLFYPSIALVAEFAFHAIPLAVLALGARLTAIGLERSRLLAMVVVCTIEPTLQVVWGADTSPLWANAYVGAHLLAFNLLAVHIFRRYGFLTVYAFRLTYYLWWHIAWGAVRLFVLFGGEA